MPPRPPAGDPIVPLVACGRARRPFCWVITGLFLWWGSHAVAGTLLTVGVQVTMCTSSPPPWRMTRDLMLAAGRSAVSQVRGVAPSTSWVALSAWAKASSAAGMSWS
ncbi:MAG: hypothetical protein WAL34_16470, partial [Acidobacteriaceae bacterium]